MCIVPLLIRCNDIHEIKAVCRYRDTPLPLEQCLTVRRRHSAPWHDTHFRTHGRPRPDTRGTVCQHNRPAFIACDTAAPATMGDTPAVGDFITPPAVNSENVSASAGALNDIVSGAQALQTAAGDIGIDVEVPSA